MFGKTKHTKEVRYTTERSNPKRQWAFASLSFLGVMASKISTDKPNAPLNENSLLTMVLGNASRIKARQLSDKK